MLLTVERHEKVWGHEEWIVNNGLYCGKRLILRKGWQCSLHYHKVKDETFYVQSGFVRMTLVQDPLSNFRQIVYMHPGDGLRITPGLLHSFAGLEDSVMFEFSTQHDEADSYRVEGELSGPITAPWGRPVESTVPGVDVREFVSKLGRS